MVAKFTPLPDHTQLPASDGAIADTMHDHHQASLLWESLLPVLQQRHPDGQYFIGSFGGIYWRIVDPPLAGCKAPDWFYVPGAAPTLNGVPRRSYVMWQELLAPHVLIEFVSGDGGDERDRTPWRGKFWVYENVLRAPYYAIYDGDRGRVEVYRLVGSAYRLAEPNERGHFPIASLGVELGIWRGRLSGMELPWLRWWDSGGELLLSGWERVERQRAERTAKEQQRAEEAYQRAEEAYQRAEEAYQRAERLAARLREMGVDPDQH